MRNKDTRLSSLITFVRLKSVWFSVSFFSKKKTKTVAVAIEEILFQEKIKCELENFIILKLSVLSAMWLIVKWKEFSKRKEMWEVYYSAVPESWIKDISSPTPILMWPLFQTPKDRKAGNPIKGETSDAPCTILASGFTRFEDAQQAEKKWYDSQKNKDGLTTENSGEDTDADKTPDTEDLQKDLEDLLGDSETNTEKGETSNNIASKKKSGDTIEVDSEKDDVIVSAKSNAVDSEIIGASNDADFVKDALPLGNSTFGGGILVAPYSESSNSTCQLCKWILHIKWPYTEI